MREEVRSPRAEKSGAYLTNELSVVSLIRCVPYLPNRALTEWCTSARKRVRVPSACYPDLTARIPSICGSVGVPRYLKGCRLNSRWNEMPAGRSGRRHEVCLKVPGTELLAGLRVLGDADAFERERGRMSARAAAYAV